MPALDKYSNIVRSHGFLFDKSSGASSTVNAAAAKDQANLTVAGASSFANGQDIVVGSGETTELCRILSGGGTTSLVMTKNLKYDHPVGDLVTEQAAFQLGTAEADGIKFNIDGETTDVFGVMSRLLYNKVPGFVSFKGSMRMPTPTVDILAVACGVQRSEVIGDGTAAQQTGTVGPRQFWSDGSNFNTLKRGCFFATIQTIDGSWRTFYAFNCAFNPTAMSVQFARGVVANVPFNWVMSGYAIDFTNSQFVPSTTVLTYDATKQDMIAEVVGVDYGVAGTATTITAQATAGAYQITVASTTGMAAGSIVKLGSGDQAEYHEVHAIVSLVAQLRTQVKRTWASGSAAAPITLTTFSGLSVGGATYSVSGTATERKTETQRAVQDYLLQNITPKWTFALSSLTPENHYLSVGAPSSDYASSVLTFRNAAKNTGLEVVVMRFLALNGKSVKAILWQPVVEVSQETVLSQAVESQLPVSLLPAAQTWMINA